MQYASLTFKGIRARSVLLKLKRPGVARIATIAAWPSQQSRNTKYELKAPHGAHPAKKGAYTRLCYSRLAGRVSNYTQTQVYTSTERRLP
jgi:hypothetical protein